MTPETRTLGITLVAGCLLILVGYAVTQLVARRRRFDTAACAKADEHLGEFAHTLDDGTDEFQVAFDAHTADALALLERAAPVVPMQRTSGWS